MFQLLTTFFNWFQFVGIAPYKLDSNESSLGRHPIKCIISFVLLIAFWIQFACYVESFENADGLISKVLSHIQLAANAISFTIIIVVPMKNCDIMNLIVGKFVKIDKILGDTNNSILYTMCLNQFKIIFCLTCTHLTVLCLLDFYATVIDSEKFFLDWIITVVPLVWSSFMIAQVGILILWLYRRSESINQILWDIERSFALNRALSSTTNVKNIAIKISPASSSIRTIAKHLSNVFQALNEICDLVNEIESFYGLIFLSSFASIFIQSAIQIYSAFTFIICYDSLEDPKPTVWLIVSAALTGVTCIIIIFGITTVSERLTNGVRNFCCIFDPSYKFRLMKI